MTKKTSRIYVVAVFIVVGLLFLYFGRTQAHANPSSSVKCGVSASATSTYNKVSAGAGTTTITCNQTSGNLTFDKAILNLLENASTTAPTVGVRVEHSYDGNDWYAEVPNNTIASTTATGYGAAYVLTFATSSDAQYGSPGSGSLTGGLGGFAQVMRTIEISTPTRYNRVILYGVAGSGSLYGEIVAKQQTP